MEARAPPTLRAPRALPVASLARYLSDRTRVTASLFRLTWSGGDAAAANAAAAAGRATVGDVAAAAWGASRLPGGGWEDVESPLVVFYRT